MALQLLSVTAFICSAVVISNSLGKADAYLINTAYSWKDIDLDNIIPHKSNDEFNKPLGYFVYSIQADEGATNMNKNGNDDMEEIVVPLSDSGILSSKKSIDNETEKAEEVSNKEFMNDMYELVNSLGEEDAGEDMSSKEEEREIEVSVPLVDDEITIDPLEELKLFSLTVPETKKVIQKSSQKELFSHDSDPIAMGTLSAEPNDEFFFIPSNSENLVQIQKPTSSFLGTRSTGGIILEMDLVPANSKLSNAQSRSMYSSNFAKKSSLLPFLLGSGVPDLMFAHSSRQPFLYPSSSYVQKPASSKFYFNSNGEIKYINPKKILNSLKATSIGEIGYQRLGKYLISPKESFDDSANVYRHTLYHHGEDMPYGSFDFGNLLHDGILLNAMKESRYNCKGPHALLPSPVENLELLMNTPKRFLNKMIVLEPPAVLRIEPVICQPTYKQPQTHIVF